MPRQPLFKHPTIQRLARDGKTFDGPTLGSGARLARPEHIAKIGLCLTLWPDIDLQLALLLAALTHADTAPMMAVYSVIRRATGRYEAIRAAASVSVNFRGQSIISAIMSFTQTVEGHRNDIAHGHWGIVEEIPDVIVWIHGSHAISTHVDKRMTDGRGHQYHINFDTSHLFYYKIEHFDEIMKDIRSLRNILQAFTLHASNRDGDVFRPSDALCARIETFAPIRQGLTRINGYVLQPTPPKQPRRQKPPEK
jgi:hypothetical protein